MRMKYDRNQLLVTLQDKWALKSYATDRGAQVSKLLHVTEHPEDMPFDNLPQTCFIKANHGCKMNIVRIHGRLYPYLDGKHLWTSDGNLETPTKLAPYLISRDECIKLCSQWLRERHVEIEWAYQHIQPKIIVEEWLTSNPQSRMDGFCLFVINGKVALIKKWYEKKGYYSRNWESLGKYVEGTQVAFPLPNCPPNIPSMIEVSEALAADIDMLRVDFVDTEGGPRLIETAVYSMSGAPHTPTPHHPTNVYLGRLWKVDQTHFIKKIPMRSD